MAIVFDWFAALATLFEMATGKLQMLNQLNWNCDDKLCALLRH
ncbi:hypothetical protein [Pantanalinema sp. GBBB05]